MMMKWGKTSTAMVRTWWADYRTTFLRFAVALMASLALLKLGDEFRRLLWESGYFGAVDLKRLHIDVSRWFAGMPVYTEPKHTEYLPASYAMLWPFLGWLAVTPARRLWAATTVVALGWLIHLIVKESGADTPLERVFVALMLLSMNATGVTIGNGQLIVHLLPPLLAGLLLLRRGQGGWGEDLLAAALILVTLVKGNVSLPFLCIVLFVPGRLRPALLVTLGYVALTLFAASFQEPGFWSLLHDWLVRASVTTGDGYAELHAWLNALGLKEWIPLASSLVLVVLGFWIYQHRHGDFWLVLGVTALAARFWMYHRIYDDLLILLPMVALFRIAKRGPSADGSDVVAGVLLATTVLAMLAPARLRFLPAPWHLPFTGGHTIVWIAVLIFLLHRARRENSARFDLRTSSCTLSPK